MATVPGTVLTSYLNAGAIPDPNFGQNQLHISDSYFYSDFWYRTEFTAPPLSPQQFAWLNFDGINWKAEVYLNGEKLGRIEGGFMRGRFDVTGKLLPGKPNALAVRIEKNATPGSAKQKTFESRGQKWRRRLAPIIPRITPPLAGIGSRPCAGATPASGATSSVTHHEAVTIEDPFVSPTLPLPDIIKRRRHAWKLTLVNHTAAVR